MGDDCSIWFGAVLRGDVHSIRIGNKVNIQDNATIHATYKKSPTNIGNNVSIAHNAVIHGCTIKDNVLIGMGAIVLDDAVVESNTIVAAGSVVTKGTVVESGWVYAGTPAKKMKQLGEELLKGEVERIVNAYSWKWSIGVKPTGFISTSWTAYSCPIYPMVYLLYLKSRK